MNFAQKKVLSVAAGLASIVFTIVSVCTATFAWFSTNEQVSASGMNVRVASASSPINLTYDVLKFDDDTKLGVSYGQTPAAIELPEYDSYISKKNEYANVILRLEATFTEGLSTDDYVAFDIDCSADLFKTVSESTYIDDQTSNVIQYKSVVYSYTLADELTPPSEIVTVLITDTFSETPAINNDARYRSATTYFDSLYASTVYVSPAERNSSKVSNKIVTLMPEIGTRSSDIESIVIYLELSYNFGLVDNYMDTRFNSGETTISLTGDINDLSFYTTNSPATLDSITLSTNSISLIMGDSTSVSSTSSGDVTWRAAEDTGSVSLSSTSNTGATITGVDAGHAVVSATTGQASAYLDAAIARIVVADVQLNRNSLNGLAGNTDTLTATPYNFSGTVTYSWSTDNSNVSTVSSSGNPATVTYVDTGTAKIICTATDGTNTAYATCTVSVIHPIVTLNYSTLQESVNDIVTLIATTSNFSGTITYSWASTNSTIVSVADNNSSTSSITCNALGTATIMVTASVNGTPEVATDTCVVNVVNFSLDTNKLIGEKGKTSTLTATAAENTGLIGNVTYSWSTDPYPSSVVTVSASSNSATITFDAVGTATITVEASNGTITLSASCDIIVGELNLDKSELYAMNTATSGILTATAAAATGLPPAEVEYIWSTSNGNVAACSANGNIATIDYIAAGTTLITCKVTYEGKDFIATANVFVASAYLDNTTLSGPINGSGKTIVTASGFTGTISYSVTSTNDNVAAASMDSTNKNECIVSYGGAGTATLSIEVSDTIVSTTLSCVVTVIDYTPTSITLNSTSETIELNQTFQASVVSSMPSYADKSVTWSVTSGSSNATVSSSGLITATQVGSAVVTATSTLNAGVSASISITIVPAETPASYTATIAYGDTFNPALPTASGLENTTPTAHTDTTSNFAFSEAGIYKYPSNTYMMFVKNTGYLFNTQSLETVTSVAITYTSGTSTTGQIGVYFGNSIQSAYTTTSNRVIAGQSATDTFSNATTGYGYFQVSTSVKNVQITQIVVNYTTGGAKLAYFGQTSNSICTKNFVPWSGQTRGNALGTSNFFIGNASVLSEYDNRSSTAKQSSGSSGILATADNVQQKVLINWVTSTIDNSTANGILADTTKSRLNKLKWVNINHSYNYFLICKIRKIETFLVDGITIVRGAV